MVSYEQLQHWRKYNYKFKRNKKGEIRVFYDEKECFLYVIVTECDYKIKGKKIPTPFYELIEDPCHDGSERGFK